jgi:ATP-binding protein involved in chromosome partitioning
MNINIIKQKLNSISDNDLGYNLEQLEAVKIVEQQDDDLFVLLELVPPINWIEADIRKTAEAIISELEPNVNFTIEIKEKELPKNPSKFLTGVKNIIAVAAGKGGVGKSAMAANLAASLSLSNAKVGLIDGDIYGPSQPTIWGMKDVKLPAEPTESGKTIVYPAEKHNIKIASMGFLMQESDAAIVRGPILASYLQMLIEQIEWGELDFIVFDLPPGTGDIQLTLTQKVPLTGAVVVTTPQEISVVDVRRSVKMFEKVKVPVLGVIENMSYFIPEDAPDKKYYIFGQGGGKTIADEAQVRFLGEVPLLQKFRESNDNGLPYVLREDGGEYAEKLHNITASIVQQIRKINYEKLGSSELSIEI